MTLSIYNKASVDSLLSGKASLSGATFTGGVTATGLTITSGSGGVLTFADGTTQSTAGGGGGGASWGSITGSISSQTDLIGYFGNYLPLSGGTLTGSLTTASAGITFADASVQTTAATNFIGGSISTPITYGNMTTDSYFGADIIGVELTGTEQNSVLTYEGLSVTDGSVTASFNLSGITFADGSTLTTAPNLLNYLLLNGGTMTGILNLASTYVYVYNGTSSSTVSSSIISTSDSAISSTTAITPSYLYSTNGSVTSYFTAGYIQFAEIGRAHV